MALDRWMRTHNGRIDVDLKVEVTEEPGRDEFDEEDELLVLSIGGHEFWRETAHDRLVIDYYGDGGPGLPEAVVDKFGEVFAEMVRRQGTLSEEVQEHPKG